MYCYVKGSMTNSNQIFMTCLKQLRACLGPLKVPETDPTGPPPAPPFPDSKRKALVDGPRCGAHDYL